jgi:hypothetical protein
MHIQDEGGIIIIFQIEQNKTKLKLTRITVIILFTTNDDIRYAKKNGNNSTSGSISWKLVCFWYPCLTRNSTLRVGPIRAM